MVDIAGLSSDKPARPESRPSQWRGAFNLLAGVCLTLAAALATVAAVFYLVPDETDYARVSLIKHRRLAEAPSPRLVLVGGSNLAYGLDSERLEAKTGCPAVNMGMNGLFGVRYMLAEVRSSVRPNDVIVIALEYDSFLKSVDGNFTDHAMVTKHNPEAFAYLTLRQRLRVITGVAYGAQQKVLRVMRDAGREVLRTVAGPLATAEVPDVSVYERYGGFNRFGDLVSHVDAVWTGPHRDGWGVTEYPEDPGVIPLLQAFTAEMAARGVTVLISQTPISQAYHDRNAEALAALHGRLKAAPSLTFIPRPARDYAFPPALMFDTDYHVSGQGRARRTDLLAEDLLPFVRNICPSSPPVPPSRSKT